MLNSVRKRDRRNIYVHDVALFLQMTCVIRVIGLFTQRIRKMWVSGPHTMLCCTWHLNAQCAVWSALSTQCTVNLEHSNALSTQCTRSNGHSALSATHLLGTKLPVRALCVVPYAREPRRPPWASLSLSLPLTRALPRLDLPVSVLSCDVRRYMPKPSGANWNQLIPVVIG